VLALSSTGLQTLVNEPYDDALAGLATSNDGNTLYIGTFGGKVFQQDLTSLDKAMISRVNNLLTLTLNTKKNKLALTKLNSLKIVPVND
jgi:hypothetical protein